MSDRRAERVARHLGFEADGECACRDYPECACRREFASAARRIEAAIREAVAEERKALRARHQPVPNDAGDDVCFVCGVYPPCAEMRALAAREAKP